MATRQPAKRPDTGGAAVDEIERSIVTELAKRHGLPAAEFLPILRDTVFKPPKKRGGAPGDPFTNHEMAAGLVICHRYQLDPFVREIFITRGKGGGVLPIVSVDGWLKIINAQPSFDGMEVEFTHDSDGGLVSATCTMHDKERKWPVVHTEWFSEARRDSDPWRDQPHRMLEWRAIIQAGRIAYGISGIFDEDEASTMRAVPESDYTVVEPAAPRSAAKEVSLTAPKKKPARRAKPEPEPEPDPETIPEPEPPVMDEPAPDAWEEWLRIKPVLTDDEIDLIRVKADIRYINTSAPPEKIVEIVKIANEMIDAH